MTMAAAERAPRSSSSGSAMTTASRAKRAAASRSPCHAREEAEIRESERLVVGLAACAVNALCLGEHRSRDLPVALCGGLERCRSQCGSAHVPGHVVGESERPSASQRRASLTCAWARQKLLECAMVSCRASAARPDAEQPIECCAEVVELALRAGRATVPGRGLPSSAGALRASSRKRSAWRRRRLCRACRLRLTRSSGVLPHGLEHRQAHLRRRRGSRCGRGSQPTSASRSERNSRPASAG